MDRKCGIAPWMSLGFSPLLFILFLTDLESFLRSKSFRGVSLNSREDVLMLFYADDLIIFAHSQLIWKESWKPLRNTCIIKSTWWLWTQQKRKVFTSEMVEKAQTQTSYSGKGFPQNVRQHVAKHSNLEKFFFDIKCFFIFFRAITVFI